MKMKIEQSPIDHRFYLIFEDRYQRSLFETNYPNISKAFHGVASFEGGHENALLLPPPTATFERWLKYFKEREAEEVEEVRNGLEK